MNTPCKKVGIIFHGKLEAAIDLAVELERFTRQAGATTWRTAAAEEDEIRRQATDSDLVLAVGGDGTLLRAARGMAGCHAPLVGINMGKLGFMTELTASEAFEKLPLMFSGQGWIDTRAVIKAEVHQRASFEALNDVVIGRGETCRIIVVEAKINGIPLTTYRADGVIVATATGSTSYALAAGGPIVYPQSREMLLQPISPHLSFSRCLVLPPNALIELSVSADRPSTLCVDGQVDVPLHNGEKILVRLSKNVVRFLRLHPPAYFYESLTQRLKGEPLC